MRPDKLTSNELGKHLLLPKIHEFILLVLFGVIGNRLFEK